MKASLFRLFDSLLGFQTVLLFKLVKFVAHVYDLVFQSADFLSKFVVLVPYVVLFIGIRVNFLLNRNA
jgi:hypothetical protein